MPYYPLSPNDFPPASSDLHQPTSTYDHPDSGIRSVRDPYAGYDDPYDSFVNDAPRQDGGRPPSFRSNEPSGGESDGRGLYLGPGRGTMTFESDLDAAAGGTEPLRLNGHRIQSSYDPDLELHLESPTPAYSVGQHGVGAQGDVDEWREDVKDPGEFEESFEASRVLSEGDTLGLDNEGDEEEGLRSPAASFQGGFGAPPPTAHLRRKHLTNRRVKLTGGNLVIPCAIPTRLLGFLPRKDSDEFTQTRYTAVTCGPEEFHAEGYTLRPSLCNRQTELMVVVTMYNENEELFCRTMHGVMKNISQLCKRKKSATWGQEGWKKVVVCVVADGRRAIHPRVLDCLSALGVYQPNVATNRIDDKPVQAHIYEHTTQMSIAPDLTFKGLEKGIVPCQVMFCLKENNAKKINSHRWALQAFAPQLQPNVVMLIDVGTKPASSSLYHLWKAFDANSNVGGACGEIVAMKGKFWTALLNPLVAAQNFEYKISNILDKPLESIFGYISVLPGAFSAYRYIALKNDELGHGPLASYFKGEHLAGHDADLQTSNMYLAEDRILCWELVAKRGDSWVLKYVKAAKGETDVYVSFALRPVYHSGESAHKPGQTPPPSPKLLPTSLSPFLPAFIAMLFPFRPIRPDTVAEFISQRRRWLNGSFFAGVYALAHTFQLFGTQHSKKKIFFLLLQAVYNLLTILFAWIGLSSYWIFFFVLTKSLEDPTFKIKNIGVANVFMQYLYMGAVIATFLMSMGNRPKAARWKYITVMGVFSFTTAYMFVAAGICVYHAVKNSGESLIMAQIVVSLASTYGCYVLASLIHLDPWHIVTSMLQYMLLAPTYINVLNIYAFANLHDFSWGTKDSHKAEIDLGVTRKVNQNEVDMALPADQTDIDSVYDRSLHNLKTRPMIIPPVLTDKQKEEAVRDHYQSIRTNILLAWVLTNAVLVATILEGDYASTFSTGGGNGRTQIYLVIILIFVAIMSLIRFVGSTAYQIDSIVRLIGGWVQRQLFARRQGNQGQTSVKRRTQVAMSEAGTEIKSEKTEGEEKEREEGFDVASMSAGRESAPMTTGSWFIRG